MTTQLCSLPAEDLVAWDDGYLTGGRRELVEAHVMACPHCRERLAAFDEVDRLLRECTPLTDDPNGRAIVRARLAHAGCGTPPRGMLAAPMLLLLLLLLLVVVSAPVTGAGFPLGRYITFGEINVTQWLPEEERRPVEHVASSDPDVQTLPFRSVESATLPLGLVRVERSTPGPERLEQLYRDGDDLAILILQAPAEPGMVTIDGPSTETILVRDTTVLMVMDPRPDAVSDLFWERDGAFFTVLVIEAPVGAHGGLKTEDALEIVEALIAAQDVAGA